MEISSKGLNLIKTFEGFVDHPYYATKAEKQKEIATIGYGNTFYPDGSKVKITDKPITEEEGERLLRFIVKDFEDDLKPYISQLDLEQYQYDAIISFVYNIGLRAFINSTFYKHLKIKDFERCSNELLRWDKQNGKSLLGLTRRRQAERKLFLGEV